MGSGAFYGSQDASAPNTSTTPLPVGPTGNIREVAAGTSHTLFVMDNQTVWGAGNAASGEMGTDEYAVAAVPTLLSNICNVFLNTESFDRKTIVVYPNPAIEEIKIYEVSRQIIERIVISDLTGKTIFEQSGNIRVIDVSALSSGLYLLNVEISGNNERTKFVKK